MDRNTDIFDLGIKRPRGMQIIPPEGLHVNLGSGNSPIAGALNLDRPDWNAPRLDYVWLHAAGVKKDSVAVVHMYHFLEHLTPDDAIRMLKEVERVLMPGGLCKIVVPHAMCPLAYQAPDHRSYWTEEGFQDMFYSAGYDSAYGHEWDMDITWMMVAGVKWSNLCVLVELCKRQDGIPYPTPWRRDG